VEESLCGTHFEELADGLSSVGSGENMGLEAVAFTGGARNKDIREKLHGYFFVSHASATFASTPACVEGEGGCGKSCALGFLG
jgi:hypothetical protein